MAYRLMPNHVHLMLTLQTPDGQERRSARRIGATLAFVNARMLLAPPFACPQVAPGQRREAVEDEARRGRTEQYKYASVTVFPILSLWRQPVGPASAIAPWRRCG